MVLRAAIIEDEKHSRETLKSLLEEFCEGVDITGTAGSVAEGIALIREQDPDLVFLDIELQTGTGFDILNEVQDMNFEVVFTTAFEHYAVKAIKFSSIDYLLKPIDLEELQKALDRVRKSKDEKQYKQQLETLLANLRPGSDDHRKLCLSTSEGVEFVNIKDIIYCEASGSYTHFRLNNDRNLLVSRHLKEYELLLADYHFMRVHNSYVINLHEVKKYVKADGGYIIMNDQAEISISPRKRVEFLDRMGQLT